MHHWSFRLIALPQNRDRYIWIVSGHLADVSLDKIFLSYVREQTAEIPPPSLMK